MARAVAFGKGRTVSVGEAKTPNLVLRCIRETERRESRDEFAQAVVTAGRQLGDHSLACDARLVARWEDGEVGRPRPAYQRALETLTGRPFDELGFRPRLASQALSNDGRGPGRLSPHLDGDGQARATIGFGQPGLAAAPDDELVVRLARAKAVSATEVGIMRQQVDHLRALDRQLALPWSLLSSVR